MPKATVPEEPLVSTLEPSRLMAAPGAMPRNPELVRAGLLPLLPTDKFPSMVQLAPVPLMNVPPEVVLAFRAPLALVVSKPPSLVKVLVLLMTRVPPASTSDPLLVSDAAVEMPELTTIV